MAATRFVWSGARNSVDSISLVLKRPRACSQRSLCHVVLTFVLVLSCAGLSGHESSVKLASYK